MITGIRRIHFGMRPQSLNRLPQVVCLLLVVLLAISTEARRKMVASKSRKTSEAITDKYLAAVRGNKAMLNQFFHAMPKGVDIHLHYTGAIYTETLVANSVAQNYFLCQATGAISAAADNSCHWTPISAYVANGTYQSTARPTMMQAWSTYNYIKAPTSLQTPADHFFTTFNLFNPAGKVDIAGGMNELKHRAKAENVQYLELMYKAGAQCPYSNTTSYQLKMFAIQAAKDDAALDALLDEITSLAVDPASLASTTAAYLQAMKSAHAGLDDEDFTVRFLVYGTRILPPDVVFGQLLTSFNAVNQSNLLVGVNLVGQENDPVALRDFWLHVRFFRYLKAMYPGVKVALHAGELALGMVPPEQLGNHISDSVMIGGADRIGHGVDLYWENAALPLLKFMADHEVVLEMCLSSNEFILGELLDDHPNTLYLMSDVPIVVGSDDPGILRGSLSEEYVKFAKRYSYMSYPRIKEVVRNAIRYSFIKEAAVKAKLLVQLELRFAAFEKESKRQLAFYKKLVNAKRGKASAF